LLNSREYPKISGVSPPLGEHAATTADGRDRKQLERICRYLLCPPFAHDAVTALPGGRVRVSFRAPRWSAPWTTIRTVRAIRMTRVSEQRP
jgi:hypothetical protein